MPPSVHPETGQAYAWISKVEISNLPELPGWIANRLRKVEAETRPALSPSGKSRPARGLEGALDRVRNATKGCRNSILNSEAFGMARKYAGAGQDVNQLYKPFIEVGLQAGLGIDEVNATLRSAIPDGAELPLTSELDHVSLEISDIPFAKYILRKNRNAFNVILLTLLQAEWKPGGELGGAIVSNFSDIGIPKEKRQIFRDAKDFLARLGVLNFNAGKGSISTPFTTNQNTPSRLSRRTNQYTIATFQNDSPFKVRWGRKEPNKKTLKLLEKNQKRSRWGGGEVLLSSEGDDSCPLLSASSAPEELVKGDSIPAPATVVAPSAKCGKRCPYDDPEACHEILVIESIGRGISKSGSTSLSEIRASVREEFERTGQGLSIPKKGKKKLHAVPDSSTDTDPDADKICLVSPEASPNTGDESPDTGADKEVPLALNHRKLANLAIEKYGINKKGRAIRYLMHAAPCSLMQAHEAVLAAISRVASTNRR